MSAVFNLPDELCNEVLCEWLNVFELCNFDSAVCSRKYRLSLLSAIRNVQNFDFGLCFSTEMLNWTCLRGISVYRLTVFSAMLKEDSALFSLELSNVQQLTLYGDIVYDKSIVLNVVNKCSALKSFACSDYQFLLEIDENLLSQLDSLTIDDELLEHQLPAISRIKSYCLNLISIDCGSSLDHLCVEIIKQNTMLKSITLAVNESILDVIATCCRTIEHVHIYSESFSLAKVGLFIRNCSKSLKSVRMRCKLEEVYYGCEFACMTLHGFSDASNIISLLASIKKLEHIVLSNCSFASDLISIILSVYQSFLISVKLHSCPSLAVHNVSRIFACPKLEYLSIRRCSFSTSQYIEIFSQYSGPGLPYLAVTENCLNVSTIVEILQYCRVYECLFEGVTDETIDQPELINVLKATIHQAVVNKCTIRFSGMRKLEFDSGLFTGQHVPHFCDGLTTE